MLVHDAFDFQARGRGETVFAVCDGRSYTYAEARNAVLDLSRALVRAGVRPGRTQVPVGGGD